MAPRAEPGKAVASSDAALAPEPKTTDPRGIALVGFQNESIGRFATELSPLRAAIGDYIVTELAALPGIRVLQPDAALADVALISSSVGAATAYGRRVGAATVIVGGFAGDATGRMRITARLIDVGTSTIAATVNAEGTQDTVLAAIAKVAAQVSCQVRLTVLREEPCRAEKTKMSGIALGDVLLYSRALDAADRGSKDEAIRLFREFLVKHPDHAPARRELTELTTPVRP